MHQPDTRPVVSTPLKVFIAFSIILHVFFFSFLIISSSLATYYHWGYGKPVTLLTEEEKREKFQQGVEKIANEKAKDEAREKITEVLKKDVKDTIGNDIPPARFNDIWKELQKTMEPGISEVVAKLEKDNFEIPPQTLETLIGKIKQEQINCLLEQLSASCKEKAGNLVRKSIENSIPEFNRKTRELIEQVAGAEAQAGIENLLNAEKLRRSKERTTADSRLTAAQNEVNQAVKAEAEIEANLARANAENRQGKEAAEKAGQAVESTIQTMKEAQDNLQSVNIANTMKNAEVFTGLRGTVLDAKKSLEKAAAELSVAGDRKASQVISNAAGKVDSTLKDTLGGLKDNPPRGETADARKTADSAAQALSNLMTCLTRDRQELDTLASRQGTAGLKEIQSQVVTLAGITNSMAKAEKEMHTAANAARTAAAAKVGNDIENTAAEAQNIVRKEFAGAVEALKSAPTNTLPSRETMLDLQRHMGAARKGLESIQKEITAERSALAAKISEFERQTNNAVTRLLTSDSRLAAAEHEVNQAVKAEAEIEANLARANAENRQEKETAEKAGQAMEHAMRTVKEAQDNLQSVNVANIAKNAEVFTGIKGAVLDAKKSLEKAAAEPSIAGDRKASQVISNAAGKVDSTLKDTLGGLKDNPPRGETAAARKAADNAVQVLSNLMTCLTRDRQELDTLASQQGTAGLKQIQSQVTALASITSSIEKAHNYMLLAANATRTAAAAKVGNDIENTATEVQNIVWKEFAGAVEALKSAPTNTLPSRETMLDLQRHMGAARKGLESIQKEITTERSALAAEASEFERQTSNAVAHVLTSASAPLRHKTTEIVEKTLRENVAEDFRTRTEKLAAAALASKHLPEDSGFIKSLGQQAVDTLMDSAAKEIGPKAFADLAGKTAKQYGVNSRDLENGTVKSGVHDRADNSGRTEESEKNGSSRKSSTGKKGTRKGENITGGIEESIENQFSRVIETSTANALKKGASYLKLPSLESISNAGSGLDSTDTEMRLSVKLALAKTNILRNLTTGGQETLSANLSEDIAGIGARLRAARGMVGVNDLGWEQMDFAEYRKNIETVIEKRVVEESLLVAPSLTNPVMSAGHTVVSNRVALMLVGRSEADKKDETVVLTQAGKRKLEKPSFTCFSYGAAAFTTNRPVIDGDLSEWKGVQDFALKGHPQGSKWSNQLPTAWEGNRNLMVQWDLDGFYFAYKMADDEDNRGYDANLFWDNDSLELWFDFSNRRTEQRDRDQQQFWFWPLGAEPHPGIIGGEWVEPIHKGQPCFRNDNQPGSPKMAVKRTTNPRGYQVELFLPVSVFKKPNMLPGRIIAFNFSINNGKGCYLRWTTNLGGDESEQPNLWGDLVLLGSDVEIQFVKPDTNMTIDGILPGEPLGVRITDLDMNLDRKARNQIKIRARSQIGGSQVAGCLQETGPDTGVFEGSFDTVECLEGSRIETTNNVLTVTSGDYVEIIYHDQARKYGERNFNSKKTIPVGVPVFRMSKTGKQTR